jgi:hypothetical protein
MAFALPSIPNFNVQTPDVLGGQQKAATLSQMLNANTLQKQLAPLQVQEQQQRVQQMTQANQIQQMELQSQQAMVKAWSDPDFTKKISTGDKAESSGFGFDPDAMTSELVNRGVMPKDAFAMTQEFVKRSQTIADTQKAIAQTGEANAAQRTKGMKVLADKIGSILDLPASKAGAALDALKQDLVKNPKAYAGIPQQDLAHVYSADLEHLPAMANLIGLEAQIADFHKSKAEATKAEQGIIPAGGGVSPETQQQVQKDVLVNTNPQIQAGKEAVAKAEGEARATIEAQTARGSNAALANVPPHLVPPASAAATKAGEEYAAAKSVSDRMNLTMDAARKGNVVSYQIIPEEGTLQITTSQGVHRINQTEIAQYAGGGSLWQRMQGHFGKALTGKSIPDSVLNDMAEIQKIQADGARSKYENSLKTINDTYGSAFKPVEMAPPAKMILARDPRGVLHEAKEGTALPQGWKLEK